MRGGACIEWQGGRTSKGYGRRYFATTGYGAKDHREALAHRAAWEEVHGSVPEGLTIHHRCENKLCVNVAHMQLRSRRDHAGAGGHGKLTQADADAIRCLRAAGRRGIEVAAAFGISAQQVCNIVKGRCWA